MKILRLLVLAVLAAAACGHALAAEVAAEVTMLVGRGTVITPAGDIRVLEKDAPVYSGEIVTTGVNSFVNLKFTDGGLVTLRPGSRFELSDYRYEGAAIEPQAVSAQAEAPPGRALFRLLKGGLRTITGLLGKRDEDEYRTATPVATIGIRGTDYLAVLCDLACQTDPVVRADLPDGASAAGASVVGVFEGRISVTTPNGETVELGPDEFVLVLADGRIIVLGEMPRFLIIDPIPNPQSCIAE